MLESATTSEDPPACAPRPNAASPVFARARLPLPLSRLGRHVAKHADFPCGGHFSPVARRVSVSGPCLTCRDMKHSRRPALSLPHLHLSLPRLHSRPVSTTNEIFTLHLLHFLSRPRGAGCRRGRLALLSGPPRREPHVRDREALHGHNLQVRRCRSGSKVHHGEIRPL